MRLARVKMFSFDLFFIFLLFNELQQASLLQCKSEQNQDVDWFVLYKIPKVSSSKNLLIKEGVAYLYMDSDSFPKGWALSAKNISSKDSIPAYTLAPLYDTNNAKNSLWLLYNDKPPNQAVKIANGHSKGAIVVKEDKGFWLVHSVPNFPPEPDNGEQVHKQRSERNEYNTENLRDKIIDLPVGDYAYPSSGKLNGQSFLCISTNKDYFDVIGKQLMYNQIIVYKRNLPQDLSAKYTVLVDAANEKKIKTAPFNNKADFHSTRGMVFTSFAKSSKWQKDLYDDFVAPQLNTDLYAETWLNGRGKLPSECNQSSVMNVQSVYLSEADVEFKSTHDHSKWAVSTNGKNKKFYVCIGDINRADTQFERGGGTVCFNLPEVWKNYKDSVKDVEPCPKPQKKGFFGKMKYWLGAIFS